MEKKQPERKYSWELKKKSVTNQIVGTVKNPYYLISRLAFNFISVWWVFHLYLCTLSTLVQSLSLSLFLINAEMQEKSSLVKNNKKQKHVAEVH